MEPPRRQATPPPPPPPLPPLSVYKATHSASVLIQSLARERMDNFEQLLQLYEEDEDAVYLCHDCNSVITLINIIVKKGSHVQAATTSFTLLKTMQIIRVRMNDVLISMMNLVQKKKAKDIITCLGCNSLQHFGSLCRSFMHE